MEINGCNINCRNLFSSGFWNIPVYCTIYICFVFLLCECFTVIAKQRIDSGFFLFQAEMKKKQEKKKNKKTKNRADSSDDEFMWLIWFYGSHTISSYGMKSSCFIFIPLCIIKKAHRLKLITGGTSILLAPVGSTVIRDQTVQKMY